MINIINHTEQQEVIKELLKLELIIIAVSSLDWALIWFWVDPSPLLVYLRLIPDQLQSLTSHARHKLYPSSMVLYEVLERIGKAACKLKLQKWYQNSPCISCQLYEETYETFFRNFVRNSSWNWRIGKAAYKLKLLLRNL